MSNLLKHFHKEITIHHLFIYLLYLFIFFAISGWKKETSHIKKIHYIIIYD